MAYLEANPPQEGYIKNSILVLLAFATAFFPRILSSMGAPSIVNFLHFAIVPSVSIYVIITARTKDRKQIATVLAGLNGLLTLFGVVVASALLNNAGIINVFLDYMLLSEPFMFLLAIISIPMSSDSFRQVRKWIIYFCAIHIFLAYFQNYVLRLPSLRSGAGGDLIQGVFFFSGSGHVVGSSVAMIFGLYYVVSTTTRPVWVRGSVFLTAFWQMIMADAKQVLLSFLVDWVLLMSTKFKRIGELLKYVIIAVLVGYALIWCVQNVPAFRAFNTWARPEIYGPDGEATLLKTASLRIISSFYTTPLNWLFGLGPGHTVGRLGGWMLKEYASLLRPLGATTHPASQAVWDAVAASWLGDQSSMFSPLFGWAGIWGDLGLFGLATYLYLGSLIWKNVCSDDFSKFLLLDVIAVGFIFSQMEEPGYMLTIAMIIGLRWQERHSRRQSINLATVNAEPTYLPQTR